MNSGDSKATGGTGWKSATTQKKVQLSTKSQLIYKSLGVASKKSFNKLLNELLHEKAAAARNTFIDLSVKERMVHDWAILPLRERDEALKEAEAFF